jgi:predicted AAA+ superfamily ATPase
VFVTGARQVGKSTLSQQLQASATPSQYLNYDVAADRTVIERQSWAPDAKLLVLDELHKKSGWKPWLKGVIDVRPVGQQQLVTGSTVARRAGCMILAKDQQAVRPIRFKYEGTPHFPVTASSAKIGLWKSIKNL